MRADYANSGLDIQRAMLAEAKRIRGRVPHPLVILWNGREVQTADRVDGPKKGRVRVEFLSCKAHRRQGMDIEVPNGKIRLADGSTASHLRIWNDPKLPKVVEYPYFARDGALWVSNVYERMRGAEFVPERWTGTAGMVVDAVSGNERNYHCSPGDLETPDFGFMLVRLVVVGDPIP